MELRKKILVLLIFSTCQMFSQEGVIVSLNSNCLDLANGTYQKDLDNVYSPYVGIWEGIWDNKKYTFLIEKTVKRLHSFPNGDYYYKDDLATRYKVVDLQTTTELANNLMAGVDQVNIWGISSIANGQMRMLLQGDEPCKVMANIVLETNLSNPNVLTYYFSYNEILISEGCPFISGDDIPVPVPTAVILLNKI